MRISLLKPSIAVVAALAAALVIAACGSGGGGEAKKGGTMTILETAGGVDSLDPGYWYYQSDYENLGPTQRWLYNWGPTDTKPVPDLATGLPKSSNGGKTLTIKIQSGIKYSAPLQNRTVKAADIKYSMERCFLPQVGNGYANAYYGEIQGASDYAAGKTNQISGIQTPNDTTIVLKLNKPQGVLSNANALGLPCTGAVPKDYAQKYDKGKTSTYGDHQVFTGPYMITNDGKGNVTGYKPGQSLTIVRNPSYVKKGDYQPPAYLDRVEFHGGNDATVAAKKTLQSQNMLSGDYAVPPVSVLKSALSSKKSQVMTTTSGGNRYISLNTKVKPLDNVNVRRALSAAIDRTALLQTRGGPTVGIIATHFIPPDIPGFEEAGGKQGPGFDFMPATADLAVAQKYMKKAGYSSGKYTGPALLTIADNQSPAKETAEAFQSQVGKLGFKLQFREVPHATMQQKFCNVPKAAVAICPNLGWGKDFFDAQSFIDPLFNGKNIVPSGNVNTAQVDDPKINSEIEKAKTITNPTDRANAWGSLDKQVTDQSYFLTWTWDNYVGLVGTNVKGVQNAFNGGAWDLAYSSLK